MHWNMEHNGETRVVRVFRRAKFLSAPPDLFICIGVHLYLKSTLIPRFLLPWMKIDFRFRILAATRAASAARHPGSFSKEIFCRFCDQSFHLSASRCVALRHVVCWRRIRVLQFFRCNKALIGDFPIAATCGKMIFRTYTQSRLRCL